VEPLVGEHPGHLVGDFDPQRDQVEPGRDDRGAAVEGARLAHGTMLFPGGGA
jgi:hypothetical protein